MIADASQVETGQIRTDFVSFHNRAGLRVAACLDYGGGAIESRPWVVVAPKYGETKKSNLQLAYYLVANGLNVLRFDHTNHVGESEGNLTVFTLSGAVEDVLAAFDFLEGKAGVRRATLVANSLSARTAIRAAALDPRAAHLVCLVGIVNLRHTLREVYRDDLVGGHMNGRRWGVGDMLGVEMDYDGFLRDIVAAGLHDLEGTREDLRRAAAHVSFFAAERDVWVRLADVRRAAEGLARVEVTVIPGAMHELRENAVVAEAAFRDVVACCAARARAVPLTGVAIVVPDKRAIARQNKIERDRLRRTAAPEEDEREFWSRYLKKYQLLRDVDDFQSYLRLAGTELGRIGPGEVLLDAGCGNGLFGLWVLRELLARREPMAGLPPVYVGLDLTSEGLREAWGEHVRVLQQMGRRFGAAGVPVSTIYGQTDLDTWALPVLEVPDALRFAGGTFDKICCSLVLSYLQRPGELLREFYRVLRPGGRVLLSSMKPHCDMSEIYRDFITQQLSAAELEAGRNLLREAGKIRLKEEHGLYQFYSGEELLAMLEGAGFQRGAAHLSFGGQTAVAVAEK